MHCALKRLLLAALTARAFKIDILGGKKVSGKKGRLTWY